MATNPSLAPKIGPDGLLCEAPVIAYTEKIIAEEQLQLRKYIDENYSKIRDVERELANLSMEMKLTAGPKKAALEHLRKKIEMSTEKIRLAKQKEEESRKVWEAASQTVKDEEALKQKLCEDLNNLVQESSNTQFARLEELKRRLEALNPGRAAAAIPQEVASISLAQNTATADASTTRATDPAGRTSGTASSHSNAGSNVTTEGEGRGRKKNILQGRGKGSGAVPKSREPPGAGWTGAGFDVDGRI